MHSGQIPCVVWRSVFFELAFSQDPSDPFTRPHHAHNVFSPARPGLFSPRAIPLPSEAFSPSISVCSPNKKHILNLFLLQRGKFENLSRKKGKTGYHLSSKGT